MRHQRTINHLGRKSEHRKALLANMAASLIMHKRITTTVAKAKALRTFVEPLITKSKEDTTSSRRIVFSYLNDKFAVSELFREVAAKVASRPGGYTRILKTGNRPGDNADMCIIELVDYNENMLTTSKGEAAGKTTRRKRTPKKKAEKETTAKADVAPKAAIEEVKNESSGEKSSTSETEETKE
jgi:large subunit ribosomal protein L17